MKYSCCSLSPSLCLYSMFKPTTLTSGCISSFVQYFSYGVYAHIECSSLSSGMMFFYLFIIGCLGLDSHYY